MHFIHKNAEITHSAAVAAAGGAELIWQLPWKVGNRNVNSQNSNWNWN